MDPWYKVTTAREEVRQGRSFNPDEFAIALEQVVEGRGPEDYRDPSRFFARTYFTQALSEHGCDGVAPLGGRNEQHIARSDASHAVWRRQDTYPDGAVSPGEQRLSGPGVSRS